MVKKIFHFSPFTCDENGHGGSKRTAQILSIFSKEYDIEELDFSNISITLKTISPVSIFVGLYYYLRLGFPFTFSFKGLIRLGVYAEASKKKLQILPKNAVLLIEDFTSLGFVLAYIARYKFKYKVIGVIHNIESLVPEFTSKYSGKQSPNWFIEEINSIRNADFCLTISREEQWLLNLYGIQNYFIPYSPTLNIVRELEYIKKCRQNSEKFGYLILGTVNNPPTRLGVLELIKNVKDLRTTFIVAGFGTENLKDELSSIDSVVLRGTVSKEELKQLLISTKAAIVHQNATTGVLTRIQEFISCGVPIYANTASIRTYYSHPQIKEYQDFDELRFLLKNDLQKKSQLLNLKHIDLINKHI